MPNWALNKLEVVGAPDALRDFLAANTVTRNIRGVDTPVFSFEGILPMPSMSESEMDTWCTAHWGCKWDAKNPEIADAGIDAGQIAIDFDSTWCAPLGWYFAVVARYDNLSFALHTAEPNMDFYSLWMGRAGNASCVWEDDWEFAHCVFGIDEEVTV